MADGLHVIAQHRMAAALVSTRQGRLKSSFFAPARTEIPLFHALVAVVGAGRVCPGLGGKLRLPNARHLIDGCCGVLH
jgi:hypothetical protein